MSIKRFENWILEAREPWKEYKRQGASGDESSSFLVLLQDRLSTCRQPSKSEKSYIWEYEIYALNHSKVKVCKIVYGAILGITCSQIDWAQRRINNNMSSENLVEKAYQEKEKLTLESALKELQTGMKLTGVKFPGTSEMLHMRFSEVTVLLKLLKARKQAEEVARKAREQAEANARAEELRQQKIKIAYDKFFQELRKTMSFDQAQKEIRTLSNKYECELSVYNQQRSVFARDPQFEQWLLRDGRINELIYRAPVAPWEKYMKGGRMRS